MVCIRPAGRANPIPLPLHLEPTTSDALLNTTPSNKRARHRQSHRRDSGSDTGKPRPSRRQATSDKHPKNPPEHAGTAPGRPDSDPIPQPTSRRTPSINTAASIPGVSAHSTTGARPPAGTSTPSTCWVSGKASIGWVARRRDAARAVCNSGSFASPGGPEPRVRGLR